MLFECTGIRSVFTELDLGLGIAGRLASLALWAACENTFAFCQAKVVGMQRIVSERCSSNLSTFDHLYACMENKLDDLRKEDVS